jgi:hypothetical protein
VTVPSAQRLALELRDPSATRPFFDSEDTFYKMVRPSGFYRSIPDMLRIRLDDGRLPQLGGAFC